MRNKAFTLIELLAATALSALLLIGVLGVLTSLRASAAQSMGIERPDVFAPLLSLIRRDLSQASSVTTTPERTTISTFVNIDQAGNLSHRPVRVEYFLEQVGNLRCLVRQQTNLDELTNRATSRQVLYVDVASFQMSTVRFTGTAPAPATTQNAGRIVGNIGPIQIQMRLAKAGELDRTINPGECP
jgi:prepilin-type N-terminal cleavage/methylation domain-containing protein